MYKYVFTFAEAAYADILSTKTINLNKA